MSRNDKPVEIILDNKEYIVSIFINRVIISGQILFNAIIKLNEEFVPNLILSDYYNIYEKIYECLLNISPINPDDEENYEMYFRLDYIYLYEVEFKDNFKEDIIYSYELINDCIKSTPILPTKNIFIKSNVLYNDKNYIFQLNLYTNTKHLDMYSKDSSDIPKIPILFNTIISIRDYDKNMKDYSLNNRVEMISTDEHKSIEEYLLIIKQEVNKYFKYILEKASEKGLDNDYINKNIRITGLEIKKD